MTPSRNLFSPMNVGILTFSNGRVATLVSTANDNITSCLIIEFHVFCDTIFYGVYAFVNYASKSIPRFDWFHNYHFD